MAIHSYTGVNGAIHSYTLLYTAIQRYTQLYTVIHCYTALYTAIQGYKKLYRAIQSYTELYTVIHGYTQGNFWVIAANLGLSFLAVFHLAYLGIMFGGDSEIQEKVIMNKNDFITVKIFLARFIISVFL